MESRESRIEDRRGWLRSMRDHVKPGRIVEYGCGSGFVLEMLSADFSTSMIMGVDRSLDCLIEVRKKSLRNVIPIQADMTRTAFGDGVMDTALFVASLHVVYSYQGREKVEDAFRIAHDVLKEDGTLIIQDFLKPSPELVEIVPMNDETLERLLRFAEEFRPREVRFQRGGDGFLLDIADAVEFISKYRSPNEEDWKEEMTETHFFFTEEEYLKVAENAGFAAHRSNRLTHSERWWNATKEDIGFDFEPRYSWIELVLKKRHTAPGSASPQVVSAA